MVYCDTGELPSFLSISPKGKLLENETFKNSAVLQLHSLTVLAKGGPPLPTNGWLTRKETLAPMGAYSHIIRRLGRCAPQSQKHPKIVLPKSIDVGKASQGLNVEIQDTSTFRTRLVCII